MDRPVVAPPEGHDRPFLKEVWHDFPDTPARPAGAARPPLRCPLLPGGLPGAGDRGCTSLVYHLRPAEVQFHMDDRKAPDQAAVLRADLARPVFATLDARGKVLSVRFDPVTGALAQHMTRTLLAALQFVGPPPGAA